MIDQMKFRYLFYKVIDKNILEENIGVTQAGKMADELWDSIKDEELKFEKYERMERPLDKRFCYQCGRKITWVERLLKDYIRTNGKTLCCEKCLAQYEVKYG